jgi:hypothetical protein
MRSSPNLTKLSPGALDRAAEPVRESVDVIAELTRGPSWRSVLTPFGARYRLAYGVAPWRVSRPSRRTRSRRRSALMENHYKDLPGICVIGFRSSLTRSLHHGLACAPIRHVLGRVG